MHGMIVELIAVTNLIRNENYSDDRHQDIIGGSNFQQLQEHE
jgi:hypothetical protein